MQSLLLSVMIFDRVRMMCPHVLSVDGASVNTGIHGGLGALLRQSAEWLTVVHCFNHRLELVAQDAFKGTFFDKVDAMLTKLFYLYQKSPKRLREFSEIFEKSVPKPAKAGGDKMDWPQNVGFKHCSSELRRIYYPLGIVSQDRFSGY